MTVQKSLSSTPPLKIILFLQRSLHSRGESHVLKCSYIFHERFPNHFPGHSSFASPGWRIPTDLHITLCVFKCEKHAFSASRTKCPVHVCVCECVYSNGPICAKTQHLCVYFQSSMHMHSSWLKMSLSLCMCACVYVCSNGPVCVHSSIAKKEVCVCACMYEGVCVCI